MSGRKASGKQVSRSSKEERKGGSDDREPKEDGKVAQDPGFDTDTESDSDGGAAASARKARQGGRQDGGGGSGSSDGDSSGSESDSDDELAILDASRTAAQKRPRDDSAAAAGAGSGAGAGAGAGAGGHKEDSDTEDTLQVDFNFEDPKEIHYLSVKRHLSGLLPGVAAEKFPIQELADVLVKQASVGTMVTADSTGDAYAFISAINMHTHQKLAALKFLRRYLLEKAPEEADRAKLEALFAGAARRPVGLLLNCRLVNVPPQIAPALHQGLLDDLAWAVKNEISEAHRAACRYDTFIVLADRFQAAGPAPDGESNKRRRTSKADTASAAWYYYKFEEDMIAKHAVLSFSFPVPPKQTTSGATIAQSRQVLVIPAKKYRAFVAELATAWPTPSS